MRELVAQLHGMLQHAGIESAQAEAEWLIAGSLGISRTALYLWEEPLEGAFIEAMRGLVQRRLHGEPLHYVLGHAEFCGHRLMVSPAVLIPRPETEVLTDQAIRTLRTMMQRRTVCVRVLDVGTGSASIAISLARALPPCVVVALELSWMALCVARSNTHAHGVSERVWFIQTDWLSGVRGAFDMIVSNPPYVPASRLDHQAGERAREPRMSVDGGADGMVFHRRLLDEAPRLLASGGILGFECAEDQTEVLADCVRLLPWVNDVQVFEDLAGRPRGLWIRKTTTPQPAS